MHMDGLVSWYVAFFHMGVIDCVTECHCLCVIADHHMILCFHFQLHNLALLHFLLNCQVVLLSTPSSCMCLLCCLDWCYSPFFFGKYMVLLHNVRPMGRAAIRLSLPLIAFHLFPCQDTECFVPLPIVRGIWNHWACTQTFWGTWMEKELTHIIRWI